MKSILGISAFYHDSAAALVVDGEIIAAAQEERFSREKHDRRFPHQAVQYCLRQAGITAADLDHVVFYEKPLLKFERLIETYLGVAPAGFRSFLEAMPIWFHQKLHLPREMNAGLGGLYQRRYVFTEHHEAHAASAFFPSPFEEAAILTLDGVGEWATASLGLGSGHHLTLLEELSFPHSLGLLYSAFTYYCGFKVNSGEYKLMGLAPYGEARYESLILSELMDLKEDGSLRLDLSYFNYCQGLTMTSAKFHRLFGGAPRLPEEAITQRHCDLAASIQRVTETAMLKMGRHVHQVTGSKNLCMAGGVALNCVGNGRLLREGPFEEIWIQPAAGDAGGALGAALFVWHELLDQPRRPSKPDAQKGSLLGPAYSPEEIRETLETQHANYRFFENEAALIEIVAELLLHANVVGWVQGRMEFGPRALGARSILGDARDPEMQSVMNLKIKFRESFRPFAPIVTREEASDYFELSPQHESPYMLFVAPLREDKRLVTGETETKGLERRKARRSIIPSVTHVDGSARIQSVDSLRNPKLHQLLQAFQQRSGHPVLINTSFNVRNEPIVCTPTDAYRCFMATNMDALVIENFLLLKADQPASSKIDAASFLGQFQMD